MLFSLILFECISFCRFLILLDLIVNHEQVVRSYFLKNNYISNNTNFVAFAICNCIYFVVVDVMFTEISHLA